MSIAGSCGHVHPVLTPVPSQANHSSSCALGQNEKFFRRNPEFVVGHVMPDVLRPSGPYQPSSLASEGTARGASSRGKPALPLSLPTTARVTSRAKSSSDPAPSACVRWQEPDATPRLARFSLLAISCRSRAAYSVFQPSITRRCHCQRKGSSSPAERALHLPLS